MTRIGVVVALVVGACAKPEAPVPWEYNVEAPQLERKEASYESLKTKTIHFAGTSKLFAVFQEARSRPHLVWLRVKRTDALTGTSSDRYTAFVENGMAEVSVGALYADRPISEPGDAVKAPQFEFEIIGVHDMRPGALVK